MAKTHGKQHYVPETYLRTWCDLNTPKGQTPYTWLFPKAGEIGKRKAPSNIFHEANFYTIKGPNGSRDLTLEQGLSQLERSFSKLRRETLDRRNELTFRDKKVLLAFSAAMYARSKFQRDHWRSEFSSASIWSGNIIHTVSEMSAVERQTSDNPCVKSYVADKESDDSLRWRYILPLSPKQTLVLNKGRVSGYVKVPLETVRNLNRVTRSIASESYISNTEILKPSPF